LSFGHELTKVSLIKNEFDLLIRGSRPYLENHTVDA
jgi:hypothetical protein